VSTLALTYRSGLRRVTAATFAACASGAISRSAELSSMLTPATPRAATYSATFSGSSSYPSSTSIEM